MPAAIKLAVLTEDRIFGQALASFLARQEGLDVVEGGESPPAGNVDIALVDASDSRDGSTLDRLWALRERLKGVRLIALGLPEEGQAVLRAVEAGAQGYLLRDASTSDLLAMIRAVHRGETPCSPEVASAVLARIGDLARRQEGPAAAGEPLTRREIEVLAGLAEGLRNKEIARRLGITAQTVKNHMHRLLLKLGVHHRREALRRAYELGLLDEARRPPRAVLQGGE